MSKTLHTSLLSFNSLRPEMVIAELGVTDIQLKNEDILTGAQKQDVSFMARSPFGQVPLYTDTSGSGVTVHESRAIARYIALANQSESRILSPTFASSPEAFASLETALSLEAIRFDPFALAIGFQKVIAPLLGKEPAAAVIRQNKEVLRRNLEVIDEILAGRKYMAGQTFTVADVNFLPNCLMLIKAGEWKEVTEGLENWGRWWSEVSARESFRKVRGKIDSSYGPDKD